VVVAKKGWALGRGGTDSEAGNACPTRVGPKLGKGSYCKTESDLWGLTWGWGELPVINVPHTDFFGGLFARRAVILTPGAVENILTKVCLKEKNLTRTGGNRATTKGNVSTPLSRVLTDACWGKRLGEAKEHVAAGVSGNQI